MSFSPQSPKLILLVLISLVLISAPLCASSRSDIIEMEARFSQAIKSGGKGLDDLLHEKFFYNTVNGTSVGKYSLINSLKMQEAIINDLKRSCLRVELLKDSATATAVSRATFTMAGQQRQLLSRYFHLWVYVENKWQLFARQVTSIKQDGSDAKLCLTDS